MVGIKLCTLTLSIGLTTVPKLMWIDLKKSLPEFFKSIRYIRFYTEHLEWLWMSYHWARLRIALISDCLILARTGACNELNSVLKAKICVNAWLSIWRLYWASIIHAIYTFTINDIWILFTFFPYISITRNEHTQI